MNTYIFREYDIRGVVSEDFTDDVVENLGKGFGTLARRNGAESIAVSGDVRETSPHLKAVFSKGVLSTGIDVVDIGILPTPVNYFSMFHLDVDGAAQITGSHNPPEYNGFKLSLHQGAVYGDAIQQVRKNIEQEDFDSGNGQHSEKEILQAYIQMVLEKITLDRRLRIAVDCGNAAGALAAPDIFRQLNLDVTGIYCDVDSTFPNHHPDPTVKKNLTDLIATVKSGEFDVGIAYDGDADRVGIIDDQGEIVWADYLMTLFLDEVIQQPGEKIIFDVKCSQALEQAITEKGGTPVMWKTGHSLIKQKMKETGAKFGGEMSGHLFFADDYFGYDDAIYVSARLLQTLSRTQEKISSLLTALPHYESTPEIRMECENDEEKFNIAAQAKKYFSSQYEYIDVDGIRIKFGDGWGLVRASNTQPVIVCRFEAKTPERLEEIRSIVLTKLQEFGQLKIEH